MSNADTCAYVSLVCDDLASSERALSQLGFGKVWEGQHPVFDAKGVLLSSRSGGIMLLGASTHPAVQAVQSTKERWLHLSILAQDLSGVRDRAQEASAATKTTEFSLKGLGSGIVFEIPAESDGEPSLFIEFLTASEDDVFDAGSSISRIESVAYIGQARTEFTDPLKQLGYVSDPKTSDAEFPTLGGINSIVWLRDNYLELNEPLVPDGVMKSLMSRMGRSGIFGVNVQPDDLDDSCARWRAAGIETNTEKPIILEGNLHGKTYGVCDIVTVNPRSTGGGRLFALRPLEYPWDLR
jgi:hypothetical protein